MINKLEIKKDGTIINKKTGNVLKGSIDSDGYNVIKFEKKLYKRHRLVALKFIPNPNNLPHVNHINGNKLDNRVENLEWISAKNNIHHAWKNNLATNNHLKRKVKQIDPTTNQVIKIYESYREASIETGISETNISAVCRGYKPKNRPQARQTAGGYKWETCND